MTQLLQPPSGCTYCLRDLLVLEALEVAMLLRAVHHKAALGFHPALCHKVQLCVHVHSLHLSVIVVIRGKAVVQQRKTRALLNGILLRSTMNVGQSQ